MARILFIDDEVVFSQGYKTELEGHFEVEYTSTADNALVYVEKHGDTLTAMVVDIMMPPPQGFEDATDGGFETGLMLLEKFQESSTLRWPLPIIILTNQGMDVIQNGLRRRQIDTTAIEIRQKVRTPAFTLPRLLTELIRTRS